MVVYNFKWGQEATVDPNRPPTIPSIAAILLASGHLLKVRGVTLYPSGQLNEIAQLRLTASEKLGGVSTGLGFIGSPAWAVGGGIALGLIEKAMSTSARREGLSLLRDADSRALRLLRAGVVFPIGRIENRDQPIPSIWAARSGGENFAHDGGEFVNVDTSTGAMSIRWQHVASYSIVPDQTDEPQPTPTALPG